jgi:hypothetical protein
MSVWDNKRNMAVVVRCETDSFWPNAADVGCCNIHDVIAQHVGSQPLSARGGKMGAVRRIYGDCSSCGTGINSVRITTLRV